MQKRGQMSAMHILVYAIVAIVAVLIFYFGYRAVFGVTQAEKQSAIELLKLQQKADISKISLQEKTMRSYAYALPSDYDEFCFVDLTKKNQIPAANLTNLKSKYPIIYNSIQSETNYNAFLIGKDTISYNVGSVKINCPPYYACFNKTGARLVYRLSGMRSYATPSDVCIEGVNLPPSVEGISPDKSIELVIGATQTFKANATDPEGSGLNITWSIDFMEKTVTKFSEKISSGAMTTLANQKFSDVGTYVVRVVAKDDKDQMDLYEFTVNVLAVPTALSLNCNVVLGQCAADQISIFSLSDQTNAHAAIPPFNYDNKVCCKVGTGADPKISTFCNLPGSATVIWLSGSSNAHAASHSVTGYNSQVCMKADKQITCTASPPGSCAGVCVVKLSDYENAHLASCSDNSGNYPISICCGIA